MSVRSGLTENLSLRRSLTDNMSVRRGLTDNLSVRRGLADNFSATDILLRKGSREDLSDKQIRSIGKNTAVTKKKATKHCSWRVCKSDSCYPESIPELTHFIRFSNVGKVKEGLAEWQKKKAMASKRKQNCGCIHVAEKVLQSTRLVKIHIVGDCLFFTEMVKLKKMLTQSMVHC